MHLNTDLVCCGMVELTALQYSEDVIHGLKKILALDTPPKRFPAIVVFSAVIKEPNTTYYKKRLRRGHTFAAFIKKNRLGTVVAARPQVNLNTGNTIQAWLWTVNRKALAKWFKKNPLTNQE
jgi:hypothetical protein